MADWTEAEVEAERIRIQTEIAKLEKANEAGTLH